MIGGNMMRAANFLEASAPCYIIVPPITLETLLRTRFSVAIQGLTESGYSGNYDARGLYGGPKMEWKAGDFRVLGQGAKVSVGSHVNHEGKSFTAITETALDGQPLEKSKAILVTACGRCENTGMQFSADRRSVGRNWGKAPVGIEPVELTLVLPSGAWKCVALAPDGTARSEVSLSRNENGQPVLKLSGEYKTLWYLLTPAEKKDAK
jgi:hypothetical protein